MCIRDRTKVSAPDIEVPDLEPLDRPAVDTEFVIETKVPEALPAANQYQPKNQFRLADSVPKFQPKPESVLEEIPLDNDFEQQYAMLPQGKIVDPETIDVKRDQVAAAIPKELEIDFGGELTRTEIVPEPVEVPNSNAVAVQGLSLIHISEPTRPY